MPEGDTVFATAGRLRAALAGRALTRSDFRVPRWATVDLTGRAVGDVIPRGKHLLTRVDGGLTVHTHLGMDGAWRVRDVSGPPTGPGWQIRLLLANAERMALGLRLAAVDVGATRDERRWVGHLGPDVLGPAWDLDRAVANLLRDPARPVGAALLDQRVLAGVGTINRSEGCFLAGIHPLTPVGRVPEPAALVEGIRGLMLAAVAPPEIGRTGPETLPDPGPPGRSLRRPYRVADRAGRPCRRCGTPVRTARGGDPGRERPYHWCPVCQPLR